MKERAQCSLVSFGQAGALGWGPRWANSHAAEVFRGKLCFRVPEGNSQQLIKPACSPWLLNYVFWRNSGPAFAWGLLKLCSKSKELYLEIFIGRSETPLCKNEETQVCVA